MCELLCAVILVFILLSMVSMVVKGDKYSYLYNNGVGGHSRPTSGAGCGCSACSGASTSADNYVTKQSAPLGYPMNRHETQSSSMQMNKNARLNNHHARTASMQQLNRLNAVPS